jgi:hypothetical protein
VAGAAFLPNRLNTPDRRLTSCRPFYHSPTTRFTMAYDTDHVADSDHWLQGDILKAGTPNSDTPFVVIITADCDIAQNKVGSSGLACLAVHPLSQYLWHAHAPAAAHKELTRFLEQACGRVNAARQRADIQAHSIPADAFVQWLEHGQLQAILDALKQEGADSKAIVEDVTAVFSALHVAKAKEPPWAVDVVRLLRKLPSRTQAATSIFKGLTLPMHLFFISHVPTETHLGYVANLRDLRFVPHSSLFRSWTEAHGHSDSWIRIGRLKPTHRHALAREFGNLYARIGFAEEFEADRDETFALCVSELLTDLEAK